MWILKWLPDWIFYLIFFVGIIGLLATYFIRFLSFIPALYVYKTPIQLVSVGLIIVATFMSGAIHDNNAWLDRVHEMENKVVKAESEAKEANDKLAEAQRDKKEKIKEKQVIVKQYIDREIVKYNDKCDIPKEFVQVLNKAAGSEK